jgi:oxygen-independent coproporphyrinogen-3 oxidase
LQKELLGDFSPFGVFDTVYIGGGTPSLLDEGQIASLLEAVHNTLPIAPAAETTIEVNPADQNLSWFKALRVMGVNRVSLGVQAFDDDALRFLGRRHGASQAREAVSLARRAGFSNIGLALIYGVPGPSLASWRQTLRKALTFAPEHLSCYELSAEEGTPLGARVAGGEIPLPGEEEQAQFLADTAAFLGEAGYIQYEVSNYARSEGLRSRHNSKYWQRIPYLGLGPGAHSFLPERRWWNATPVEAYLEALQTGRSPVTGSEDLSLRQVRMEEVLLGLRTIEGIDTETFARRHGIDLLKEKKAWREKAAEEGLIICQKGRIRCTPRGLAVADRLAQDL